MYDNVCKFIAEEFSTDLANWLLGEPILLTELSPKELSLEPIRTDSLILKQTSNLVLQVEFQTQPDPQIPFRMADYRLRVYRRYPQKTRRQVVIYLKKTNSELVHQNTFAITLINSKYRLVSCRDVGGNVFIVMRVTKMRYLHKQHSKMVISNSIGMKSYSLVEELLRRSRSGKFSVTCTA